METEVAELEKLADLSNSTKPAIMVGLSVMVLSHSTKTILKTGLDFSNTIKSKNWGHASRGEV